MGKYDEMSALAKVARGNGDINKSEHTICGSGCGKGTWGAIDYLNKHHLWRIVFKKEEKTY